MERLLVVRKYFLPIVRGSSDDGAVLCTQNSTFTIKEAETSNSLLLVPSLVMPNALKKSGDRSLIPSTVEGVFYKYIQEPKVGKEWGAWKCWITSKSGVTICARDSKKKGAMRKVAIKALSQLFSINHSHPS